MVTYGNNGTIGVGRGTFNLRTQSWQREEKRGTKKREERTWREFGGVLKNEHVGLPFWVRVVGGPSSAFLGTLNAISSEDSVVRKRELKGGGSDRYQKRPSLPSLSGDARNRAL